MQWWCSAQTGAWDWTWRPYVGVWLFVGLIGVAYVIAIRRAASRGLAGDSRTRRRQALLFGSGLALLWVALDWPVGPLGAGYLLSMHMVQFLMVGMLAPALFLLGIPRPAFESLRHRPSTLAALQAITQPVVAFFVFSIALTITHWPSVVDALRVSQLGSFALDVAWIVAGAIFWWPVIAPVPEWKKFGYLLKIAYLGLNIVIVRPPVVLLFYSKFPAYATYELAPPLGGVSPLDDQQLAGAVMKAGSAWIMLIGISVLFYLSYRQFHQAAARP